MYSDTFGKKYCKYNDAFGENTVRRLMAIFLNLPSKQDDDNFCHNIENLSMTH